MFSLSNRRSLRALYDNQLTGTIPPQIENLSQLQGLCFWYDFLTIYFTVVSLVVIFEVIYLLPSNIFWFATILHLQLFTLRHCRSPRYLNANQLSGTIPPQLANLSGLYAQNRIARYWHCFWYAIYVIYSLLVGILCANNMWFMWFNNILHLQLFTLCHCRSQGPPVSTWISSVAPFHLSSTTSLTSSICSFRIALPFLWHCIVADFTFLFV